MPKQLFVPKLVGSWLWEHPKNFGTSYLIISATVEAMDFKFSL